MTKFLVIFDVDSTLIEDEVIELLAEAAGKRAEVADVTERAMRGDLDFAESLRERVSTLAGLPASVIDETYSRINITRGAQALIEHIHTNGGKVAAVSGGFSQLLAPLAAKLDLDFWKANDLEIVDGLLTGKVSGAIVDREAKADALQTWATELGLGLDKTIAVGDGANDLGMMNIAGLSVAFNAKPKVRDAAQLVISSKNLEELIAALPK